MSFVVSVHTGRAAPLGPEHVPSGFVKHKRVEAVRVGRLGLEGDEKADLPVHGGAADFPELAANFTSGAMGENLTVAGMDEGALCVGDVHGIGSALLQVCQPR